MKLPFTLFLVFSIILCALMPMALAEDIKAEPAAPIEEAPADPDAYQILCEEMGFSVEVPEDCLFGYRPEDGCFYVWLGEKEAVPNIYVVRREKALANPGSYVHQVWPDYMKSTYGERLLETLNYAYYDIGNKRLYCVGFTYESSSGETISELVLVEPREDRDVEYVARFTREDRQNTLESLHQLVRSYTPIP